MAICSCTQAGTNLEIFVSVSASVLGCSPFIPSHTHTHLLGCAFQRSQHLTSVQKVSVTFTTTSHLPTHNATCMCVCVCVCTCVNQCGCNMCMNVCTCVQYIHTYMFILHCASFWLRSCACIYQHCLPPVYSSSMMNKRIRDVRRKSQGT